MRADALNDVAITNDVRVDVTTEHMGRRAEHVRGIRRVPHGDRVPAKPIPRWSHRGPPDVAVVRHAPRHPRGGIHTTRNPSPTASANPNPAAVMERDVAPVVITDPHPIVVLIEFPVARRLVRREVCPDNRRIGIPNRAVRRIIRPVAVIFERLAEIREGRRVGVDAVFVAFDGDSSVGIGGDVDLHLNLRRSRCGYCSFCVGRRSLFFIREETFDGCIRMYRRRCERKGGCEDRQRDGEEPSATRGSVGCGGF